MGAMMANLKARKAVKLQTAGDTEGAKKIYEEALEQGMSDPRLQLAYTVLLIRSGEVQKAKDILVKIQKNPAMNAEQKQQLFMNYAVCCYKLGDMPRALELMEKQHLRQPSGLIYGTLGYLYVEAGDAEKALTYNEEAVTYDDEDPICLDNLAQTYYRLLNDKEKAKTYFDKALAEKPGQIDTLWFLSRYDLEKGDKTAALAKLEKALEGRFSPLNYAKKDMVEQEIARLKSEK